MATKEELENAKRDEQIKEIQRKGKIAAWNEYTAFAIAKAAGAAGVVVGGIEFIDPDLIHPIIPYREVLLGAGFALLAGKSVLTLIIKTATAWRGTDQ